VRLPESGIDGFFVSRSPVTLGMYREYLNDREWHDPGKAFLRAPRRSSTPVVGTGMLVHSGKDGTLGYEAPEWKDDWPVMLISWDDAVDYCQWLTWRHGSDLGWRFSLPEEDEWEKAARGVDGRVFPWGDTFDPTFCCMLDSRTDEQQQLQLEPWGLFPADESPYGVRDLGGGGAEWTVTFDGPHDEWRVQKGGSFAGQARACRSAGRVVSLPQAVHYNVGFRVVARRGG
jgi:serine/threonine-protein kinase